MRTLTVICLLLLAGHAPAQNYTIKIKEHPDAGASVAVRVLDKVANRTQVSLPGGKVVNDKTVDEVTEKAYTETTLEQVGGERKKYKRVYTKAQETKGGKARTASYEGRTVLYELKDGKYQVSVEGKPDLDAKDLKSLTNSSNNEPPLALFLPTKAVKVGETWALSSKALSKVPLPNVDGKGSKGEGKLVKAYTKDGKQFGILRFDLNLVFKEEKSFKFDPSSLVLTLDTAIDGSVPTGKMSSKGKIAGTFEGENKGNKFTVKIVIDGQGVTEASEVKK
jgi:hypothetical protein